MKAIRLRIVSNRIARVSDDGARCGATCQYLDGGRCRIDGLDDLDVDSEGSPMRSGTCIEAEAVEQ
jgi:hypothetical protein